MKNGGKTVGVVRILDEGEPAKFLIHKGTCGRVDSCGRGMTKDEADHLVIN